MSGNRKKIVKSENVREFFNSGNDKCHVNVRELNVGEFFKELNQSADFVNSFLLLIENLFTSTTKKANIDPFFPVFGNPAPLWKFLKNVRKNSWKCQGILFYGFCDHSVKCNDGKG